MVKIGNSLSVSLLAFILAVYALSVHDVAAIPDLDVHISQENITISAGNPATVQVTYENVGDTDLDLFLFMYDEGDNGSSPRPKLIYEGHEYTAAIDTEVIFGSMPLLIAELKIINVTFAVNPNVAGGSYEMRIGGYHEKIGETYVGYGYDSFTLIVPCITPLPPTLSYPPQGAPSVSLTPTFSWIPVTEAANYRIQVSTAPSFSPPFINQAVNTPFYTLPFAFEENTIYYWRVRAENECGSSEWEEGYFKTICTIPSAPLLISPLDGTVENLRPTFSWSPVSEAITYRIQISTSSSFSSHITEVTVVTHSFVHSSDLDEGTGYYWRVRAENRCGYSEWAIGHFTTPATEESLRATEESLRAPGDCTTPLIPSLISPSNSASDVEVKPTFSWSPVSNTTKYTIQISETSSFSLSETITQPVKTTFFAPSFNLREDTTYYWRVKAENECDSSEWSIIWTFTTTYRESPEVGYHSLPDGSTDELTEPPPPWIELLDIQVLGVVADIIIIVILLIILSKVLGK